MTAFGTAPALAALAALAGMGILLARALWPRKDAETLEHTHDDLPLDHPHVAGRRTHSHPFVIDDLHRHWRRP
ncbi:hypothetical protein [Mangrovicoccus ximenensis]|uniref:hypothetical protein n=1 Tax=Mangrovicoccus ximenensis TaxID=1911570 RepID=UPI000D3B9FB0